MDNPEQRARDAQFFEPDTHLARHSWTWIGVLSVLLAITLIVALTRIPSKAIENAAYNAVWSTE